MASMAIPHVVELKEPWLSAVSPSTGSHKSEWAVPHIKFASYAIDYNLLKGLQL